MNNRDKIKEAIEKAMARIGCPPGDNADADLYRELQAAIALLDAEDQGTGEVVAWLSKTTGDMVLAEDRAGQMGSHDAYEDFTIPLYRHPPAQGKVLTDASIEREAELRFRKSKPAREVFKEGAEWALEGVELGQLLSPGSQRGGCRPTTPSNTLT